VVAAYGVVLFALLIYVVVMGMRTARIARETELLARLQDRAGAAAGAQRRGREADAESIRSLESADA
jgi:hypothetical protein